MSKILFMCVANSARSQLAEGLAKSLFPNDEIASAGSAPTTPNPFAIAVLREIGIDISSHTSKLVEDLAPDFVGNLDFVITLCAEEVCPTIISKAKRLHWPFVDPATKEKLSNDELLKRFRITRDLIREKLEEWKKEEKWKS